MSGDKSEDGRLSLEHQGVLGPRQKAASHFSLSRERTWVFILFLGGKG